MKKFSVVILASIYLVSCGNKTAGPDISSIKVDVAVERFDQDFFAIDTNTIDQSLNQLNKKYAAFLPVFFQNIVGVNDPAGIKAFYASYKSVYDSAQLVYKDISGVKKDFEQALRYVKYYFPAYKAPATLVPIIGPMNSSEDMARMNNGELTPNFIGPDLMGISLQYYLGRDFSLYDAEYFINKVAPRYRSRRFTKDYIVADAMKLVTDDIFPEKSKSKTLVEQMIERGKQWWLLDKFMPNTPDSIKTGYTAAQLNWCKENEGLIWAYIIKNEDLYSNNPVTIQTYIGDGPFTQGFSQDDSPGNLGPWIGWQIVKKYVEKNSTLTPDEIMKTDPKKILDDSKYRPK